MEPILFSVGTFFSTFIGGLVSFRNRQRLHYIMSFTAGVLIAVCFFDIIPEMFTLISEHTLDSTFAFMAIVAGFLVIHILEKYAIIHHSHEGEYATHRHPHVGKVSAAGLVFHSFLDGVGIGLGFLIDPHVGTLVAIAVIAHDFSDGLNTVSLMLVNKNTKRHAFYFLLADAAAPVLGVLSTRFFMIPPSLLVIYLGLFAGFLLYIGASDLLPEAHSKHSSPWMIALTVAGVLFIFLVTRFT